MANNQIRIACFARYLFFLSLLFLVSANNAQNISRYYTSSLQENGTLYFIFPQSGFGNNDSKSKLTYDITYLTTNDTATLNFSYFDASRHVVDSVSFIGNNKRYSSSVKKIFIGTKRRKWHGRYSSKVLFTDLNSFLSLTDKPRIILYTQQGAVELTIKARTWKKQSSVAKKILNLIKYNQ